MPGGATPRRNSPSPSPSPRGLQPDNDPAPGHTPLRHVARCPATIAAGDQDQLRRAQIPGPAQQLPGLRAGP